MTNLALASLLALFCSLTHAQAHFLDSATPGTLAYASAPTVTGISPSSGPSAGGISVTITGTNFAGVSGVRFGSYVARSVTVDSPTQITALSPAGDTGTIVDVVVNTAGRASAANVADQFTYSPIGQQRPIVGANQISAGVRHSCALTNAGGVKCWGYNDFGQLGDGTTTAQLTAMDVTGLTSGVSAIAVGGYHTCAVTNAGGVKCWGSNSSGQLGDGTTTRRLNAVDVTGLTSGVSAIAAGKYHTCALTNAGGVKCWGNNLNGQLGDDTRTQRLTSVDVTGINSGVGGIAAGTSHTCAVTSTGGAKCWGSNGLGQLGDGTTTQRLKAVDVAGLTSGINAIAAGDSHTCALTSVGAVKCWGNNDLGQLGDGTTSQQLTAVNVIGLTSGVSAITGGFVHACALTNIGGVQCWGYNFHGELGDGTRTSRSTAMDVTGLTSGVSAIAAGEYHSCALTSVGAVRCWGKNDSGQLGDGTMSQWLLATDVSGLTTGVNAIAAAEMQTCALTNAGGLKCWGENVHGQLGDGTAFSRSTVADVTGLTFGVGAVAVGGYHACAVTKAGGVKCWGYNSYGQLGDGTTIQRLTPVDVPGMTSGVSALAAGDMHTCALTITGGVKCWGDNTWAVLGDGTRTQRLAPVDVVGLTSGVIAIAAGSMHTCALTNMGGVKCWGYNGYGQLGNGTSDTLSTARDVAGLTAGVSAIAAGQSHTCAVMGTGGAKCWGSNEFGQLGDGTTRTRLRAVDVISLTSGVSSITAGAYHNCALTDAGGVQCWGDNRAGQLGNGTSDLLLTAVDVVGLRPEVKAIAAGSAHTCALTSVGAVQCWGNNLSGQRGNGLLTGASLYPVISLEATSPAAGPANSSDSWWNAGESGWGITITDHGSNAFVQWYTYDATGHNQKYVIPGGTFSPNKCQFSGTVQRVTGPAWNAANFDPNLVTRTNAGSATINFCPAGLATGTAVFSYNVDGVTAGKTLTRLPFGNDVPNYGGNANTGGPDFTDLWWNPAESGWGVSVTQHGNNLFFRIFVYDTDGRPLLFVVPGVTMGSPTSFMGTVQMTTGPYFGSALFDPNQVRRTNVGTAFLNFSDANNGILSYTVNGVTKTKSVTRLPF